MDTMPPSEGGGTGSIPVEGTAVRDRISDREASISVRNRDGHLHTKARHSSRFCANQRE
jgi:hypothetical protein